MYSKSSIQPASPWQTHAIPVSPGIMLCDHSEKWDQILPSLAGVAAKSWGRAPCFHTAILTWHQPAWLTVLCPLLCACTKPEGFGQLRRWVKLLSVLGWWPISWRDGGCPWTEKQQRWWRKKELHPRWESLGGINMGELGSTFSGLLCLHGQLCWKVWSSQIHTLVP